jgi:hypothetical protein
VAEQKMHSNQQNNRNTFLTTVLFVFFGVYWMYDAINGRLFGDGEFSG